MDRPVLEVLRRSRQLPTLTLAVAASALVLGGSCARAAAGGHYRVVRGDTLTAIAARHHTTVAILARLNGFDPGRVLLAGIRIRVPQPDRRLAPYVVRPGDTLSQIAVSHGLTVAEIARLNRVDPGALLLEGRRLMLPMSGSTRQIRASITRWADHYKIPRPLALALAWQESGYQQHVISKAGATGVMQVMPATWTYVEEVLIGRSVPHTQDGNVRVGLRYLRHLLDTFGNTQRALAGYLQGERSVRTEGIYRSSRRYIANILAIASRQDPAAE